MGREDCIWHRLVQNPILWAVSILGDCVILIAASTCINLIQCLGHVHVYHLKLYQGGQIIVTGMRGQELTCTVSESKLRQASTRLQKAELSSV